MRSLFILILAAGCGGYAGAPSAALQTSPAMQLVVANQQSASASVLRGDSMIHLHVGNGPHEAAIAPDGRTAVVSIYGDRTPGNQLAVIDLARDSVIKIIDLQNYRRPHALLFITPDLVATTSEATQNVVLVKLSTGTIDAAIPTTQRGSHMLAVTADARRGFTANIPDNSVSELDLVKRSFVRTFAVPDRPEGITVTPDGAEVWVGSNTTGKVSVINTASGTIVKTFEAIAMPYRMAASPDGKLVAIVAADGNKLVVARVADHAIIGEIPIATPRGVSIARDSRTAFVTEAGGSVAQVDLQELRVVREYRVQQSPDGVAAWIPR